MQFLFPFFLFSMWVFLILVPYAPYTVTPSSAFVLSRKKNQKKKTHLIYKKKNTQNRSVLAVFTFLTSLLFPFPFPLFFFCGWFYDFPPFF